MVDIAKMNTKHQQLQGVPETLTAGIEEIVGEQIKLTSTQVDLSEKLSVLIRQVCASDDEVNALCDHVLGLNSGTGSTPEDVFLCLVLYVGTEGDPYVRRNPLPFIPKLARTIAAPAG